MMHTGDGWAAAQILNRFCFPFLFYPRYAIKGEGGEWAFQRPMELKLTRPPRNPSGVGGGRGRGRRLLIDDLEAVRHHRALCVALVVEFSSAVGCWFWMSGELSVCCRFGLPIVIMSGLSSGISGAFFFCCLTFFVFSDFDY